ncbi:hypothetical protein GON26_14135 [Flavobacterium sp. GA093]|uniref:Lipoprotein n=1 Tax=Flavobacterium hydrocarbonoxydans TaxID=2683249 RepID=A0A6I4NSN4_9FLAO|nr:hypothetical protein [Flavobacterium hydrocarbonoxydans]MWB95505.1 hypothetical protein [Flavobacterium hydrocarbonoxydans]
MSLKIKIVFITLFITLISCERKINDLEFEKNVMTEILPSLIDSTCIDSRILNLPPPLGKPIYDKDDNYVGRDTTEIKTERENWKKELARIKNDTSKIVIAFNPIIETAEESNQNELVAHFGKKIIPDSIQIVTENYRIDFEKIKLNQNFKLRDLSKFPNRDTIWKTKYKFIFSGVFSVSRIQFDKEKKYGVLSAGFVCGRLCGQGFRIFIKKVNDKWIIDEVEGTWVS